VISRLSLPRDFIYRHGAVLLVATVLLFLVCLDGTVTRGEGLLLIVSYTVYVIALMRDSVGATTEEPDALAHGGLRFWGYRIVQQRRWVVVYLLLQGGLAFAIGYLAQGVTRSGQ